MGLIGTKQSYCLAFVTFTNILNSARLFVQKLIFLQVVLLISIRKSKTKYPRSLSAQSKQLSISSMIFPICWQVLILLTGHKIWTKESESTVSWLNLLQLIFRLWWNKETGLQYKNLWKNTYGGVIFKLNV